MRKISGKITCETKNDIASGAQAEIRVIDCGRMDAPSITLGQQIINEPKSFPINFEIEYDDAFVKAEQFHGQYALQCTIQKDHQYLFVNDSRINIVSDHSKRELSETKDFKVISL